MRATLRRIINLTATSMMVAVLLLPSHTVFAAGTLNNHPVVLDASGKIIPWTTNPADGYDTVMRSAWNKLLNAPNDPSNGKPVYYSHSYVSPNDFSGGGWPHNPAGTYAMLTESALEYYAYSGDMAPVNLAKNVATWQLNNGMTASTDNWANVPYASANAGSLTYQGSNTNANGSGDGLGVIQPDKVGAMGYAWLQLYQFDNTNTNFRDAAIASADALASHIRTGTATQSPWPFRVRASNNTVVEQYTANVIEPIQLFDGLIRAGIGNTAAYQSARTAAWNWMMTYPMQNNKWCAYFEDVAIHSSCDNLNQLIPMQTARYLMQNPSMDSSWQTHVAGLISFVQSTFGVADNGATTIKEQEAYMIPMGSHTSRFGAINAMYSQMTGDQTALSKAYYSLNWATYMASTDGTVIDSPSINQVWFTDGYGDYIRHFMTALQAQPQWAPAGQNHLTGSTSLVKTINYTTGGIQYTTVDAAATDSFRVNFTPGTITANGVALSQNGNLNQEGWTYDASKGVLRVRHDAATNIQITSGTPGNLPPSVSLTAPANGSSYTAGSTISLTASASDTDGTIAKVDFYNGSTLLGSSTTAPYSYSWSGVPAGTYNLSAVATDNAGSVSSSAAATITVTTPSTLPSQWQDSDVGSTGVAGSASYSGGVYTVKGSGVDVWDANDSFNYLSQPLNGDGSIVARVVSQQNTDPWALAGVMIRESLTANARHALAAVTPGNGVSFTSRSTVGGTSAYTNGNAGTAPYWLKLTRVGNVFTAYKSTNGTSWTQYAQQTITMGSSAYMGLAVTSHNNSVLATDTFDNVVASGSVDITAPTISNITTGSVNQNGATISWKTDELSDSQLEYGTTTSYGTINSNTSKVTDHTMTAPALAAGTLYHYRVKSTDAAGNQAVSADQTFTTPAASDTTPPSQPTNLVATTVSSNQVGLSWTASSDNVAVTGYKVYRNGTQIGSTSTTTYADPTVAQQTSYSYTVSAYDAAGNQGTQSASLSVTTPQNADTTAPSTPTNLTATASSGAVSLSWTASTDNTAVTGYRVFRNGTQVATTATNAYFDSGLLAGTTYSYTVRAYDAAGNVSASSAAVSAATPASTVGAISIDKNVVVKQSSGAASLTAPSFSTTGSNELLVAFISSDGGTGTTSVSGVTGGGVTWTLRKRVNTQKGTSEIWTAVAPTATSNISVKATRSGSYQAMMSVFAFKNAAVGTTGGANASTGASSASLTTTAANSWVWGVGNDWDSATARTVGTGQTKVDEMLAPIGDTFWVQRMTNTTPASGTTVTLNNTVPVADRWNLALIEIIPQ